MTTLNIPGLVIDVQGSAAAGRAVLLKQVSGAGVQQVELQEIHVRLLAEKLGVVPAVTAEAAHMICVSFGQATRFASESRRLQSACMRASQMADRALLLVRTAAEKGNEDRSQEIASITELAGFLRFVCEGFEDEDAGERAKPEAPRPSNFIPEGMATDGVAA